MKNTAIRLRSLCAALAALVLLLALAVPAFAADGFADLYYRMNDSAEVLTEDEDSELEASLEELSVRQSFDVVVATIDSLESEGYTSMEEYADDLYDYCQFGYGENRDGVLLVVSIGDRKWHISTCGYGITAFTDAGIQYLGEQMTPDMADGDYAAAFRTFIQWTDAYVTAAREGHPYDVDNMPKEPFSIVYLGVALVIGLVTALIVTGVMKSRLKSVAPQRDATDYVRQGSMKLTMYMMPLMYLFFCFTYPLAFSLYYVISNIVMTAQTQVMRKFYDPEKMRKEVEAEIAAKRKQEKRGVKNTTITVTDPKTGKNVEKNLSASEMNKRRLEYARQLDAERYKDERTVPLSELDKQDKQ